MIGERVPISEEEQLERNRILRKKRWGVVVPVVILLLASGMPLWFLQTQEKAGPEVLWTTALVMTAVLGVGMFSAWLFMRKINLDMQSPEKLVVPAVVVRGLQLNERRDPFLTLDIGGRRVTLSADVLRRNLPDAAEMNRLYPGIPMLVEMTPYGHVITKIERA